MFSLRYLRVTARCLRPTWWLLIFCGLLSAAAGYLTARSVEAHSSAGAAAFLVFVFQICIGWVLGLAIGTIRKALVWVSLGTTAAFWAGWCACIIQGPQRVDHSIAEYCFLAALLAAALVGGNIAGVLTRSLIAYASEPSQN
jgi:hypothetical protein